MEDLSSPRTWRARLALMLVVGVLAVAVFVGALIWAKTPAASAQATADNEPSFVVRCKFSHRNSDDPIVHPGKPGAAHSHDFFGNTSTDAYSTYESLRAAGTRCSRPTDTASYWIPTVMWNGKALTARRGIFYYREGAKDPKEVRPFPAGLKVVPNSHVAWRCVGQAYTQTPPTQCSNGELSVRVIFPDCSNGELDSADHRSHMAYAIERNGAPWQCPSTHPIPVPSLRAIIEFPIPTSTGQVTLSSGEASTMHADFFNSWDQDRLEHLVAICITGFDPSMPRPEECMRTGG
jgi:hypothetical protein